MNSFATEDERPPTRIGFSEEPIGFGDKRQKVNLEARRKETIASAVAWIVVLAVFALTIIAIVVF